MKILFLVYHGFSEVSGISKKIHYQVKGLRENGHDVRLCYYGFAENGHRCRYVDNEVIKDYGKGKWAGLCQRIDYNCIYDYCIREKIEFVYARCFMNANPWLIHFFKMVKKAGIRSVTEIPTYPYDGEFTGATRQQRIKIIIDKLFRKKLYSYMNALITFSGAKEIFGQRTICISNGVDLDSIPLHKPIVDSHQSSAIHFIGVAEVHYWHGYDRLIAGIGEYYSQQSSRATLLPSGGRTANSQHPDVYFHIVGGVGPSEMYDSIHAPGFHELIEKYGIQNRVIFHGQLFGDELTDVFNQCQFAIGSLARHRSGITNIKTLKNREYATRGIPFIYSEHDSDFDNQPYVLRAPADESYINIKSILAFMEGIQMEPAEIRKTIMPLTWKNQMQIVVDAIN